MIEISIKSMTNGILVSLFYPKKKEEREHIGKSFTPIAKNSLFQEKLKRNIKKKKVKITAVKNSL